MTQQDEQPKKLNAKQQAFVEHYLQCWNATEAARRAGYSEKTAAEIGRQNLIKLEIQNAVKARLADLAMSADEVLQRLGEQGRGSMADFVRVNDTTGELKIDVRMAKEKGVLHLIKKIKTTKKWGEKFSEDSVEIELYDAQAALVHLGKHHGLFKDDVLKHLDLGKLDDQQLEQLANGADPISVLLGTTSKS